jgi:mono/diheme cytochrome c family protein
VVWKGAFLAIACGLLAACSQEMAYQPKYKTLAPSSFFEDGRSARPLVKGVVARGSLADEALAIPPDSNAFPIPVTRDMIERGHERYNIFCAECHGLTGDGNGIVALRGLRHPPSYHIDRLRLSPAGHFYDVMTNGFGAMQDYSAQISPRDRLAIIAYIRALQLSQGAPVSILSGADRAQLTQVPAGAPMAEPMAQPTTKEPNE